MRGITGPTWTILVLSLLAVPAWGQSAKTVSGTVEVIGLRRWTIPMLQDSLRKYRPNVTLGDAACGEVLRDSLGFPDAAVLRFRDGRVVLTVVEPHESRRVVLRPTPTGRSSRTALVQNLKTLADSAGSAVEYAATMYLRHARGEAVPVEPADSHVVLRAWSILGTPAGRVDRSKALATLIESPDPGMRRAAAYYAIRYADADSTWQALAQALRDPDWSVRGAANGTLRALRETAPRSIDWRPVSADLRHLLDGTTLVFHTEVVKLLLATNVAPSLAGTLLSRDGGRLLLDQLLASHEYVRLPARQLLVRFSGNDFGTDEAQWQAWIQRALDDS